MYEDTHVEALQRVRMGVENIGKERKMKVLVAVAAYPTPDGMRPLYFVHSRNVYYQKENIQVTVINFSADNGYEIDGIRVLGKNDYVSDVNRNSYDLLICHAANLRNHYCFLKKYKNDFKRILFIYHGHEILHIKKYYPEPYVYLKRKKKIRFIQNIYDSFKINIWKRYIKKNVNNIELVFVSDWLYKLFLKEFRIDANLLKGHATVISNSIGVFFEKNNYEPQNVIYDFITIRNRMDESTYGIDILVAVAEQNPQYQFCLIGKGCFFNYYKKPANVDWINMELTHEEMRQYLNKSRIALMFTRHDSQGLMACELASFGMPLITSDIGVCNEVFRTCPNVAFLTNEKPDLSSAVRKLQPYNRVPEWKAYYAENTIMKEITLIKRYASNDESVHDLVKNN